MQGSCCSGMIIIMKAMEDMRHGTQMEKWGAYGKDNMCLCSSRQLYNIKLQSNARQDKTRQDETRQDNHWTELIF